MMAAEGCSVAASRVDRGLASISGIFTEPGRLQSMSRHSWETRRSDAAETIVKCYDVAREAP